MRNLGFLPEFLRVYFTLCSPQSRPQTIRDFLWGFLGSISPYVVLRAGHVQFEIASQGHRGLFISDFLTLYLVFDKEAF